MEHPQRSKSLKSSASLGEGMPWQAFDIRFIYIYTHNGIEYINVQNPKEFKAREFHQIQQRQRISLIKSLRHS